jgi:hypothetical protein
MNADPNAKGLNFTPGERTPDLASEARLIEIRREAELKGRVDAKGVRVPGAPFPVASAETGYYGIPLLKQPQWSWEVPIYFFVGGAAASSAVIGAVANFTGTDAKIARDARYVAMAGTAVSSALLISDLGRPARFLAMLRVFKKQSPMSVGAWVLAVFGTAAAAAAFAQIADDRFGLKPVRVLGNIAEGVSAAFGLPFSNYTGVLIGATVIPVWNHNIKTLPIHFGMSGLNSGVSILELLGNEESRPLNVLGIGACAMETYEGYHLEVKRDPRVNAPLKEGMSGWITRAGGVLSGPVPLALRVASLFTSRKRSRQLRRAAAWSSIVGSLATREGWVRAGHASAKDWRLPMGLPEAEKQSPLLSKEEFPRMRALGD